MKKQDGELYQRKVHTALDVNYDTVATEYDSEIDSISSDQDDEPLVN